MLSEVRWPAPVAGKVLPLPDQVGELFQKALVDVQQQALLGVMLNDESELIEITDALTDLDQIDAPAALVDAAKRCGGTQVFVALHLPNGGHWAEETVETVAKIRRSLSAVDVRLVDLFLTGGHAPTSMALRGWI